MKTVLDLAEAAFRQYPDRVAIVNRTPFRRFEFTYRDVSNYVEKMCIYLHERDIKKGDKVAICAPNSVWWIVSYLACVKSGIIVVPIDFNSSEELIKNISNKTKSKLLITSVYKVTNELDFERVEIEDLRNILDQTEAKSFEPVVIKPHNTLEIVFTSGSTGHPKGVILSHENVSSNVQNIIRAWNLDDSMIALSLIPLSHMFEQTLGFWVPFFSGSRIVYIPSLKPTEISRALKEESINIIAVVPSFLHILRRKILGEAEKGRKTASFERMLKLAKHLPYPFRRVLFKPVLNKIGQKLTTLIVGGAPLPKKLEEFWSGLGVRIIQGYGLTESSPIATYNDIKHNRPGSVGRCLPGQGLEIGEDGEIILSGPNIFAGYYEDKEATEEVLKDGKLYTGDVGELDEDGYLTIRGRKKFMLLSSNGLNIYPEDIEAKILDSPIIRDVVILMMIKDNESVLTAVFLTNEPKESVENFISKLNTQLESHQAIGDYFVWPSEDFPRTATKKVKRADIQASLEKHFYDKSDVTTLISDDLSKIIYELAPNKPNFDDNTVLTSGLGYDSLKRVELVSLIEEKLQVVIPEEIITTETTVAELRKAYEQAKGNPLPKTYKFPWYRNEPYSTVFTLLQATLLPVFRYYQKLRVENYIIPDNPIIFASNHTSHFDTIAILRATGLHGRKRLSVAAAKDYFFNTRIKSIFMGVLMNAFALEREGAVTRSLEIMGKQLDNGKSILIYPEGTRSLSGNVGDFKSGIAYIAQQLEVTVVPVKQEGNFQILPKGARWPHKGVCHVKFGKPMRFSRSQGIDEITSKIEEQVKQL